MAARRPTSAQPPAALGASGSPIPTVVDTILRALADALPGSVPAAHHSTYGIHMIYGPRPGGGLFQHLEAGRADGRMVDGGAAGTEAREQDGERNNYRGKQGTHGLHNSGEHNRAIFWDG